MIVVMLNPLAELSDLGLIPGFLNEADPRPAAEQFHENYAHGGGWHPIPGFSLSDNLALHYPGDPAFLPIAAIRFRAETIIMYDHAIVAILQPDGTYQAARMD